MLPNESVAFHFTHNLDIEASDVVFRVISRRESFYRFETEAQDHVIDAAITIKRVCSIVEFFGAHKKPSLFSPLVFPSKGLEVAIITLRMPRNPDDSPDIANWWVSFIPPENAGTVDGFESEQRGYDLAIACIVAQKRKSGWNYTRAGYVPGFRGLSPTDTQARWQ